MGEKMCVGYLKRKYYAYEVCIGFIPVYVGDWAPNGEMYGGGHLGVK